MAEEPADDKDFTQSETRADFKDDVLQLTAAHAANPPRVESKIRRRSAGEMNALKGDSLRNTSAASEDWVMANAHRIDQGTLRISCHRSW